MPTRPPQVAICGIFFIMQRVSFIIDGFNLYHSLIQAESELRKSVKWLNINALCSSYLSTIGTVINNKTSLEKIYYFSALATHLNNPQKITRHKNLIRCMEDTGVIVQLGSFKRRDITCRNCNNTFAKHEEKETDVAIAVKILEVCLRDECDVVVIISGDTDIIPAVRTANQITSDKEIMFAFPFRRHNHALKTLCPNSFIISKNQYAKHQFTNPYILNDGTSISKPQSW